jgi:hypothetical protein
MALEIRNTNDARNFANDPAAPSIILHYLAQHPDVKVRIAVAENKNTLPFTIMQLAKDGNPELR